MLNRTFFCLDILVYSNPFPTILILFPVLAIFSLHLTVRINVALTIALTTAFTTGNIILKYLFFSRTPFNAPDCLHPDLLNPNLDSEPQPKSECNTSSYGIIDKYKYAYLLPSLHF